MSLVEMMKEPCVLMDFSRVPDGEGGHDTEWKIGVEFMAAIVPKNIAIGSFAEKLVVEGRYLITTSKKFPLTRNDYIQRVSDGAYFHVTNKESESPIFSGLDMSQVEAELVEVLPT